MDWGLCPQTPGIYRFRARIARKGGGTVATPYSGSWAALESHPCGALSSPQLKPLSIRSDHKSRGTTLEKLSRMCSDQSVKDV